MYFVLRAVSWFIQLFPLKWLYAMAGGITKIVFMLWKEKRENVRANFRQILGVKYGRPATEAEINVVMKKNFENYGKFSVEFLYINKMIKKGVLPEIHGTGTAELDRARSYGKGLILGTLHYSNWDIAGITISGHMKGKTEVWAIADDLGGGYNRFIQESRGAYGINIVLPNKNLKDAYKCLQNNGILNVLVDRPVPRTDKSGAEVEFFGKKIYIATAAARMAIKSGAKIIIGCLTRENDTMYGDPGAILEYSLTGDYEKDAQIITQEIMKEAEKIITRHPEDWYMFRRMFGE
jgi:lauroyl/myristoyl acyltransferase